MKEPDSVSEALARQLELTANALQTGNNAGPLRELQRFLWDQVARDEDTDIEFLLFFLNTFIDKVFYNLTGDVPFIEGVTDEVQAKLYRTIGQIFSELGTTVRERNRPGLYDSYTKIVRAYVDAVYTLNKAL